MSFADWMVNGKDAQQLANELHASEGRLQECKDFFSRIGAMAGQGYQWAGKSSEGLPPLEQTQFQADVAHRMGLLGEEVKRLEAFVEAQRKEINRYRADAQRFAMVKSGLVEQATSFKNLYKEAEADLAELQKEHSDLLIRINRALLSSKDVEREDEDEDWDD